MAYRRCMYASGRFDKIIGAWSRNAGVMSSCRAAGAECCANRGWPQETQWKTSAWPD
jgi:hypothetical protein